MLSIIVSSRDDKLFKELSLNIDRTVGCVYELIRIKNLNYFGICEAYNKGVNQSNFDNYCFVHEDVEFLTIGWGNKICDILTNRDIGLIGIAGLSYRSRVPSTWLSFYAPSDSISINLIQHNKFEKQHQLIRSDNNESTEVIVCDGVFLCTRRDVLLKYPFDENNFKKFHFYDLDFALSIRKEYKVVVTYEVLLEHFSIGNLDQNWINEALVFLKKWGKVLPLSIKYYNKKEINKIEYLNQEAIFKFVMGHFSSKSLLLLFKTVSPNIISFLILKKIFHKTMSSFGTNE